MQQLVYKLILFLYFLDILNLNSSKMEGAFISIIVFVCLKNNRKIIDMNAIIM